MFYMTYYNSPLGRLSIAANDSALVALTIPGQKYESLHLPPDALPKATPLLAGVCQWLDLYFGGQHPDPGELDLSPEGTIFQKLVWNTLLTIPYGETVSYGALAKCLGSSPRAVGGAVGRNPISILIPCHCVVASDGSLTGYAGGLENKKYLLTLEGALTGKE